MLVCTTKKWGNSIGIVIPKKTLKELNIAENQEIGIEIMKKMNPLKELFGFGKTTPITREQFKKWRKELEPRF